MASKQYSTPGVYIEELDAFPHSIVAVPTAIPAFIGYTQFATDENGKTLTGIPTYVESLSDYEGYFGQGYSPKYDPKNFVADKRYYLYDSIRLFYANGGGQCYIVSVGGYSDTISSDILVKPLTQAPPTNTDILIGSLYKVQEVTLIVIPDAVAITDNTNYTKVYTQVLAHCNYMQSRIGIFDLNQATDSHAAALKVLIDNFRTNIGINYLNYGNAYFPWLSSSIVPDSQIALDNISIDIKSASSNFITAFGGDPKNNMDPITTIVNNYVNDPSVKNLVAKIQAQSIAAATAQTAATTLQTNNDALNTANNAKPKVQATIDAAQAKADAATAALATANSGLDSANQDVAAATNDQNAVAAKRMCHLALLAASPIYKQTITKIGTALNELPPSGAIAGVYTSVDNDRGVWKAPANVSLNVVNAPSVDFDKNMTDNLNVDAITGKSINAIRSFRGIGTLVFGGRTLDGNSQDWRYINVRRTMIMMEQSIKLALRAYVFEPNDANTWITVKSMIGNFLTNLWKQGALAGAAPEEAFQVMCGLGSTMTAQDILDGNMIVLVKVAVVHPAEFIVLRFQQELQTS